MKKSIEVTGKTDEAALAAGLEQLGLSRDDVSVEIIERAKKGVLGFGNTPARIRISYDVPEDEEVTAAPVEPDEPEQPAPQQPAAPLQADTEEERQQESEEAQDEVSMKVREFLDGLFKHLESDAQVRVFHSEEGHYNVLIEGKRLGALIGRRGETLDAIQQITNYAINRKRELRVRIRMDAEHYRERREKTLDSLAQRMASKALRTHRSVSLEPMNAYERHVIHMALQDYDGVTTGSVGTEPNRRVVIRPE